MNFYNLVLDFKKDISLQPISVLNIVQKFKTMVLVPVGFNDESHLEIAQMVYYYVKTNPDDNDTLKNNLFKIEKLLLSTGVLIRV